MKYQKLGIILLIVTIVTLIVVFAVKKQRPHCSYVVFIEGKLGEDADQVQHFSSGVTRIKYCDEKEVHIPTYRLIKVVEK